MIITRLLLVGLMSLSLLVLLGAAQDTKPARDPNVIRVMSYNIHITKGMDGRFDAQRIADIILKADVDLVAIQEVDIGVNRSGKVDQCAELAKLTGMHGVFGKGRDYDGGEYGQVILSRRPIEQMSVHQLPGDAEHEQRVALFATIPQAQPLPDLLLVATHLHHTAEGHRLRQAAEVNRLVDEQTATTRPAVVLLGDMNATPDSEVMKKMRERWIDASDGSGPTFPANTPERKIDYVLLPREHGWEIVSATVLEEPVASDHRPVVVELYWKGKLTRR